MRALTSTLLHRVKQSRMSSYSEWNGETEDGLHCFTVIAQQAMCCRLHAELKIYNA